MSEVAIIDMSPAASSTVIDGDPAWAQRMLAEAARAGAETARDAALGHEQAAAGHDEAAGASAAEALSSAGAAATAAGQSALARDAAQAARDAAQLAAGTAATQAGIATAATQLLADRSLWERVIVASGIDDTAAFETVAAQVAAGTVRRVTLQHGAAYKLSRGVTINAGRGFVLDGQGAKIDFSSAPNDATMLNIVGGETVIGTLAANALPGATQLTLSTTAGLAAGDWIVVYSSIANSWTTAVAVGELARVLAVTSPTTVTLQAPLNYGYVTTCLFTVTAGAMTAAGHTLALNQPVQLSSTDTLPAPLAPATTYYVKSTKAEAITLAATVGGAAIVLTDSGTGAHTITATTATYTVARVPAQPVAIRNLRGVGSAAGASGRQKGLVTNGVALHVEDIDLDGFDYIGLSINRAPGATVVRPRVRNGRATGLAYGIGYGNASRGVRIDGGFFEELRHGITGGGSQGVSVGVVATGCHCYGVREAGLDAHPGCDHVDYSHNHVVLAADAETDGDGIICQGPRCRIIDNTIVRAQRHGVFHQVSGGQAHITPIGLVERNTVSCAGATVSTRAGVATQPSSGICLPGRYYIRGNVGDGAAFTIGVLIDTQFEDVSYFEACHNDIPGTLTRGFFLQADAGLVQRGGVVAFNRLGGGTAEAYYLQGAGTGRIKNVLVAWNTSYGGSYDLRLLNCEACTYGQMIGASATVALSGLVSCRSLGGPGTPVGSDTTVVYAASQTVTAPEGYQYAEVDLVGGGGGGGGGRRGAAGTARTGGAGGAAGGRVMRRFSAAELGATFDIAVGVGGTGGTAATADDTNGGAGSDGGATTLTVGGVVVMATGIATGGPGGNNSSGPTGGTGGYCTYGRANNGGNGGNATPTAGSALGCPTGPGAGGGAGGINTANGTGSGLGGSTGSPAFRPATAGAANGGNGAVKSDTWGCGSGGGGGSSGNTAGTTAGTKGGDGGGPGGGGGGGGAATNGANAGAGGKGADGEVRIRFIF